MRRLARALAPLAAVLYMTVIVLAVSASDDFAGTGALSGSWTHQTSQNLARFADELHGTTNVAYNCAFYSGETWAATHSSKLKVVTVSDGGDDYVGVGVDATADVGDSAFDGYVLFTDGAGGTGHFQIQECLDGACLEIAHYSETIANGDTIKLARLAGGVLQAYKNDVEIACDGGGSCNTGVVTDSTFTGGRPSACIFDDGIADDWAGADIASAAASPNCLLLGVC